MLTSPYQPLRESRSEFVEVRGLRYHVRVWGEPEARPLFMLHGWMDVSASFQFLVDSLRDGWRVLAPDWRGYGLTQRASADCYWFPDYVADLDRLLRHYCPDAAVDLVGHSMGGNVACLYAGVRPQRVRRLVNLEGLGMPGNRPSQAPARYRRWLDQLQAGSRLRDYGSRDEVVARLMKTNPRLAEDRARFLALHWSAPNAAGRFELLADPAHKLVNPVLYRVEEVLAIWREIAAPVLWVTASVTDHFHEFTRGDEYQRRLAAIRDLNRVQIADSGHMLHHDQPREVAQRIEAFLGD
ncbi:MAG TPA: alpha/beta hydrolase [Burkholderiaceae bacterium]|jgi:pimeloyl-ACP methyl ester carboxylesterase|nr:alpha/beta hydrolase [Burkholderiaceae bacterium]